jgi:hypothetical protein
LNILSPNDEVNMTLTIEKCLCCTDASIEKLTEIVVKHGGFSIIKIEGDAEIHELHHSQNAVDEIRDLLGV